MGDEQSVLRSFKNASRGAKTFEHDLGKTARGALAATVSFKGLGRSVAFASSYFLGGAGFAYLLKSSVGHAEDLEKAQRSLAVVIRKTGGNVAQTLPDLEKFAKAQADVGVSAVQAEQGLARASAITGSTTAGLRAYREALLISKATGKSFNMVLIAAAKANNGQTTALARYIGHIEKGTSAQKLFNDVTARYSGQAKANTSATEKLGAALTNVETTVGVALLPTINHYASALSDWLGKSKNQERVQRDVNTVIHDASGIFGTLAGAVKTTTHAVGGFKNLVELLLAFKLTGWALGIGRSFGLIGAQATAANGEVVALRASLLSISGMAIAPIVIPLLINEVANGKKGTLSRAATAGSNAVAGALGIGNSANGQGPTYQQYLKASKHHDANFENIKGYMKRAGITDPRRLRGGPLAPVRQPDTHLVDTRISARGPSGPVLTGSGTTAPLDRRSQIDNAVQQARTALASGDKSAKSRLVAALKQQIDFDMKYATIQGRLAAKGGKDAKKHADTMRQLLADEASAYDEISSFQKKDENAASRAAAKRLAALKKADRVFLKGFQIRLANAKDGGANAQLAVLRDERTALEKRLKVEKGNQGLQQALADTQNKIAAIVAKQKQAMKDALDSAKSVVGDLGQGPVATGQFAQTLQSFGAHPDAKMFTQDLAAQNKQGSAFVRNLNRLKKRGAPSSLIQTLLGQGQGGMDEASALAGASRGQFKAFLGNYKQRQKLLTQVAQMEVHTPVVHVTAQKVTVGKTDAHDRPGDRFKTGASKGRRH